MENRSFIENVHGQKVIVVNTLNGSINITLDAVKEDQARKRKQWRPVYEFKYPSLELEQDLANLAKYGYRPTDWQELQIYSISLPAPA